MYRKDAEVSANKHFTPGEALAAGAITREPHGAAMDRDLLRAAARRRYNLTGLRAAQDSTLAERKAAQDSREFEPHRAESLSVLKLG